jgi:hypothetical protein
MNASGALNACKSSDEVSSETISGRRVSNTWVTCPEDEDNGWKHALILDRLSRSKVRVKLRRFGRGPRPIS